MIIAHKTWMVEEANRYCSAAEILSTHDYLGRQAQINAALSIEILLKSFSANVDLYEGQQHETYLPVREHNLTILADKIPEEIRKKLELASPTEKGEPKTRTRRYIERYATTFFHERYIYESPREGKENAKLRCHPGYTDEFIKVVRDLINKTIQLYQETDCKDPWILNQTSA